MKTKGTSPTRVGIIAGCSVMILSVTLIAAILLFVPLFPGIPFGEISIALGYIGSLGAIVIGVLAYLWAKNSTFGAWFWIILGVLYFFLPLYGTLDFSLRAKRGILSVLAYEKVFTDPKFQTTFTFSAGMALLTIIVSILLMVPTAYWVQLRLPRLRPIIELITLMPFAIPPIVLVFGLIRIYSGPPFALTENATTTNMLLMAAYIVLSFPYMYRAVDTGLRAIDVRTLTEAAQSLGAGWPTILFRVIFPNLRVALLSGAFLTFAIVIGEFTVTVFLASPGFGPYMQQVGANRAYEPAALAIISFALIWTAFGLIQLVGRGREQGRVTGTR